MKRLVALLLTLVMAISLSAAMAETRSYFMAAAADAEGNEIDLLSNPEQFPVLTFSIDDEAMICAFGNEDEAVEGIVGEPEVIDEDNGVVILHVVLNDGTEFDMTYAAFEDTFYFTDPESGVTFAMINADLLNEVA